MRDWMIGLLFVAAILLCYLAIGWIISPFRKGGKGNEGRNYPNEILTAAESPRILDAVLPAISRSKKEGLRIRLSNEPPKRVPCMLRDKEPTLAFLTEKPETACKVRYFAIPVQIGETQFEGFYAVWNTAADTMELQTLLAEIKNCENPK